MRMKSGLSRLVGRGLFPMIPPHLISPVNQNLPSYIVGLSRGPRDIDVRCAVGDYAEVTAARTSPSRNAPNPFVGSSIGDTIGTIPRLVRIFSLTGFGV